MLAQLHYHGDDFEKTQVMFWSTAVCRPVRDIEVLRDLQVFVIIIILITIIRYVSMSNDTVCHHHHPNLFLIPPSPFKTISGQTVH